jgi:hypothetical protein
MNNTFWIPVDSEQTGQPYIGQAALIMTHPYIGQAALIKNMCYKHHPDVMYSNRLFGRIHPIVHWMPRDVRGRKVARPS